jgi:hypothetical protein
VLPVGIADGYDADRSWFLPILGPPLISGSIAQRDTLAMMLRTAARLAVNWAKS